MPTDVRVDIAADFHEVCVRAVLPQLEQLRSAIEHDMDVAVPVDTGWLSGNLFCGLDPVTGTIEGGDTAPYAYFVEVGHVTQSGTHVTAQPYVAPAFLRRRT